MSDRDGIGCEIWEIDDGAETRVSHFEPGHSHVCSLHWVIRWALKSYHDSVVAMILMRAICEAEEVYRNEDLHDSDVMKTENKLFNEAVDAVRKWHRHMENRMQAEKGNP